MNDITERNTSRIRQLNDTFRSTLKGGRVFITEAVTALDDITQTRLLNLVRSFDNFTEDNDPYGEHDFGSIDFEAEMYYFKIDYYDAAMQYGSEDPSDPSVTTRVLTVMHSSEY